jgi:hypothetical protein
MRILVIGSGGREHALGWSLARSARRPQLFFAPGNAGTSALGTNVHIGPTDLEELAAFARSESIDLTIVGPEVPLVHGVVDRFEAENLRVVGPTAGGRSPRRKQGILEGLHGSPRDTRRPAIEPSFETRSMTAHRLRNGEGRADR